MTRQPFVIYCVCQTCDERVELDLVVTGSDEGNPMLVTGLHLACGRLVQGYASNRGDLVRMLIAGVPTLATEAQEFLQKTSA